MPRKSSTKKKRPRKSTKKNTGTKLKGIPKEKKSVSKYILDPVFNIKSATEQLILLEDHLNFEEKLCLDCIRKHIFAYNALTREGLTLNNGCKYKNIFNPMIKFGIKMEKIVAKNPYKFDSISLSKDIRKLRKPLLAATFGECL